MLKVKESADELTVAFAGVFDESWKLPQRANARFNPARALAAQKASSMNFVCSRLRLRKTFKHAAEKPWQAQDSQAADSPWWRRRFRLRVANAAAFFKDTLQSLPEVSRSRRGSIRHRHGLQAGPNH